MTTEVAIERLASEVLQVFLLQFDIKAHTDGATVTTTPMF